MNWQYSRVSYHGGFVDSRQVLPVNAIGKKENFIVSEQSIGIIYDYKKVYHARCRCILT